MKGKVKNRKTKREKTNKEINLKNKNGITLIALVITIIVLLILAAVSIATLTGENGILTRANDAKISTEIAKEKENIELSVTGALAKENGREIKENNLVDEFTNYIGERNVDYKLTGKGPFVVKYLDSGRSYLIDENGNVGEYVDISEYVKVGNYVNYNPTILNKSGTQVEASKLTYTSPTGSGSEHGNGYTSSEEGGGQKFTAASSTKWRVLSIENEKVTLISEEPVKKDDINQDNGNFVMKGAIGYLYAEQELNEICKIYGYGYGSDTSQVTKYTYGGPLDGELTGEITGSGARSISIEDINKIAGITEEFLTLLDNNYGITTNPIVDIYYPTITNLTGKSNLPEVKQLKYTYYSYNKSQINDIDIENILFNGYYWINARCFKPNSNYSYFSVRTVNGDKIDATTPIICNSSDFPEYIRSDYAVRPVVTLKSDVIDINTNYREKGYWDLK